MQIKLSEVSMRINFFTISLKEGLHLSISTKLKFDNVKTLRNQLNNFYS